MKKLILLLLTSLFSVAAIAQAVLNYNYVCRPSTSGGHLYGLIKITEHKGVMLTSGLGAALHIFDATGDSVKAITPPYLVEHVAPMGNGVFTAFRTNNNLVNNIRGITYDSNGVQIDTFNHYFNTPSGFANLTFLDSYVDNNGNAVICFYGSFNINPTTIRAVFLTINQVGQLVKYKEYGPNGLNGDIAYSQILVKDGKFWGISAKVSNGIVGLGMDTAGMTGESYYLFKSSDRNFYPPRILPYKRNGYYAISTGLNFRLTFKSEINSSPVIVDSSSRGSGIATPFWVSSDSTRIAMSAGPTIHDPFFFTRKDENGNVLYKTPIPGSNDQFNIIEIMMFGDGSALLFGRNLDYWGAHPGNVWPWVIVRVSDMGYPYDPWKQQVVFRGVTGTAKEQEKLSITAYPNPTQDRLKFLGIAEGNIRLIDATGKELLNQSITEEGISLAHLPRGLYRYLLTYRGKYYQGSVVRE